MLAAFVAGKAKTTPEPLVLTLLLNDMLIRDFGKEPAGGFQIVL